MTPEREKQIRDSSLIVEDKPFSMVRDCLAEIDRLRELCGRAAKTIDVYTAGQHADLPLCIELLREAAKGVEND